MELCNGSVERRAVDRSVMWRERNPKSLLVVVAQRAGEIGLNRRIAQRQRRLLSNASFARGKDWRRGGNNFERADCAAPFASERHLLKLCSRKVERFRDEAAHLSRAYPSSGALCGAQVELRPRARQRHIGETALFAQRLFIKRTWLISGARIARNDLITTAQLCGKCEARRSPARWESRLHHIRNKDHRELKALRLMDGEQRNSIKVWIYIGGRWIVTRLAKLF